ncbi:MAG: class I SAM-dependent methyltransferase [Oceanisphaera sp.]|uniref:methyltransferase n=1 Tax=Oceanisphaera sp. TaxID=1929979 RepID=UPI003C71B067
MWQSIKKKLPFLTTKQITPPQHSTGDGQGLAPGSEHYRAYVGPPQDYDLVSAMVFNLLTCAGLRQHHRLLDIGCGSLRLGRVLIPYLNESNYVGVEPNRWLVEDGIANEVGADMVRIKQPRFSFQASLQEFTQPLALDFVVAQSIFSHCSQQLIHDWLAELETHLSPTGALFATFLVAEEDFTGEGWVYPGCVYFRPDTMAAIAAEHGFTFRVLNWGHPRQQWALFARPDFDDSLIHRGDLHWNWVIDKAMKGA